MRPDMTSAEVIVIGGGIIGCSVAYHLTQLGVSDVVVLERKKLTSGTTWHAAGLVAQLRASQNMTRLARYSVELFADLARQTGQETGYQTSGSMTVALHAERLEELKRQATMANAFGVNCELIGPEHVHQHWPGIETRDVCGGVLLPGDGQTNPVDTTLALAKGARQGGAHIFEDTKVDRLALKHNKVIGVYLDDGSLIEAKQVVLAGGMWSREFAAQHNIHLPLHAAEHFYLVTEPLDTFSAMRPTLRVPDEQAYYKYDAGKLLLGCFELEAKPWGMDGIPEDFCFDALPDDFSHFEPVLNKAIARFPELADAGINLFFNGPESFTPDDRYLLGPTPEAENLFVACGFNSIGIQSSGGAGKVLAEWMRHGKPPMDLWDVDVRRTFVFQSQQDFLYERTKESLGLLYDMHWPHRQYATSRNIRLSPLHDVALEQGAVMGELAGWERPNWYAVGEPARYEYTYGKPNWFDACQRECDALANDVALFDQSSYPIFHISGPEALACLQYICANDVDVPVGKIVYTQWLNTDGGIEADVTISRIDHNTFMIVSACASERRDWFWLTQHSADFDCLLTQDQDGAIIGVMGPRSTELLSRICDDPVAANELAYYESRRLHAGDLTLRANRLSYVGERGYELYLPRNQATALWQMLWTEGQTLNIRAAGFHAMNACRMEKGFKHWGDDIHDHITPLQAGLGFATSKNKSDYIGKQAIDLARGVQTRRLVNLAIDVDDAPYMLHDEPILRNGELVGLTTSAAWGHRVSKSLAMAELSHADGVTAAWLNEGQFEVEVALKRFPITVQLGAFYDPRGERMQ
jgi:4-methylaminobutanoate oxidase (formaldehyde-forming)